MITEIQQLKQQLNILLDKWESLALVDMLEQAKEFGLEIAEINERLQQLEMN
jgi:hypothetical protein